MVNAALDLLNARIVSMRPGDATLTVVFPLAADLAALRQKQRSLDGAPGIRYLDLATTLAPEILPPAPADNSTNVGHLGDGFTGAITVGRFDLNKTGSTRFATSVYSKVDQGIEGSQVIFDESAVTD
jgi:hypothetical protein